MKRVARRVIRVAGPLVATGALLAGQTEAATTATRDAAPVAQALVADPAALAAASFTVLPPAAGPGPPSAGVADGYGPAISPRDGATLAVLSNGSVRLPGEPGGLANRDGFDQSGAARGAFDVTVLRLSLTAPDTANCLAVQLDFLTQDFTFPSVTASDSALVELDPPGAWSTPAGPQIEAPSNIALSAGQPLSAASAVNGAGLNGAAVADNATGTGYAGGLGWATVTAPVTPGPHTVDISVFDRLDHVLDSAVLIDNLTFLRRNAGACPTGAGAQNDIAAPAVTLGAPVSGTSTASPTPRLSGGAGAAAGDEAVVRVAVHAGGAPTGTPLQTLSATRAGGVWEAVPAPLAPGVYTARAEQGDTVGNVGLSAPVTFTILPPPAPSPAPTGAQIAGQLGRDIAATAKALSRVRLAGVTASRGITAQGLTALSAGVFTATLRGTASGSGAAADRSAPILATGTRAVSAAGRYTVRLKLTARGARALRRARRFSGTLTVRFAGRDGTSAQRTRSVRLRR